MMSAHVVEEASLMVSFVRRKTDDKGRMTDPQTAQVQTAMNALAGAIQLRHAC